MKKVNCSLYETFNYGIQISLLLVIPQTTATTPNGCPKPLPTPTIRQLRTPASTPGTALLSKPRIPLKDIQPAPIDWW